MEQNPIEKWVFIVNPTAGNGFGAKIIGKLREEIALHTITAEVVLTEYRGHAEELSKAYAAKGFKYIIGVGGDGTVNEVARPLIHNKDIVVGVIPAGTGNDFIQILGFPNRFTEADWDTFFSKQVTSMDVGTCNDKIFLNGMGLGFDAQVASENYLEQGAVKKGGKDKYLWQIVKTLLFFKEKLVTIQSNGQKLVTNCFIHTISIGRRFAGSFFLTPKAIANDGLLDICMIKKLSLLQRFRILLMVPKGTHINNEKVNYYQTDKISLEFTTEVPFHVDGELFYASEFKVGIEPAALNVFYNPSGKHYFNFAKS